MIYCLSEVKKLLRENLFVIFIVLCLCLNIGLCFSDSGTRTAVNRLAQSGELLEGKKIYDTLDTNAIGSFYYNERYIKSSLLNQWIKAKYEKLQQSVDLLNEEDADLSYFAGEITPSVNEALFVYQLKTLMIECIIFLSLLGIRSFEMEQQTEMAALIYSSGRGRKIAKDKILAGGIVGALYCIILIVTSLAVFFATWDFSRLWDANMASSFHYVIDPDDPIFGKPFLTWQSFTLKRYFVCTLALTAGGGVSPAVVKGMCVCRGNPGGRAYCCAAYLPDGSATMERDAASFSARRFIFSSSAILRESSACASRCSFAASSSAVRVRMRMEPSPYSTRSGAPMVKPRASSQRPSICIFGTVLHGPE